jgi:hypothetical protein
MRITMAAGLLAVSGTVAATALAVAPASAVSTPVVMVNCAGQGQVRPGGYDIGCTANEMLATCTGRPGAHRPRATACPC